MNILIVDDNANNRMILKLLIEDYNEDNLNDNFEIDEASDGQEAVDKCSENSFDIVLMDMMMPVMDGIEATKIIRQSHPNIMIIAISAIDDMKKQKMILDNGAEDYIAKPINSEIFLARIASYIKLIKIRQNKRLNIKNNKSYKNLFSENIYSRHTNFIINSEDALSEFWEFFLLNVKSKYNNLSDVIRTIFSIAETQLGMGLECEVFIEESDEYQYFTMTKIDKLPLEVIELILNKNKLSCNYKLTNNTISFELIKF